MIKSVRRILRRRSLSRSVIGWSSAPQRGRSGWLAAQPLGCEHLESRQLLSAAPWETATVSTSVSGLAGEGEVGGVSVAQQWNEALLEAIRVDTPRPTVHARNLFHSSIAMYDAWAAYDLGARGYLVEEWASAADVPAARAEAISYAAYRVLTQRFAGSPGAATSLAAFDTLMQQLGYDPAVTTITGSTPAAVGNRIGAAVLAYGLTDQANESNNYQDTSGYQTVNPPLDVTQPGATLNDPNQWQPLIVNGRTQAFLTPHWGDVAPFALERSGPDEVYHTPAPPPELGGLTDADFKEDILSVIRYSSELDPNLSTTIDISPAVSGGNPLGTDDGDGHDVNPITGLPYAANVVKLGDWGRVLAEFWADGPNSETPPGHWNTIANDVSNNTLLEKRYGGEGPELDSLEWDVKLYLALNGAVHDAAIAAWDAKEAYDYVRPISMIRYMGGLGQSSDPSGPSYHEQGLPLEPDLVEVITAQTTAAGARHQHLAGHEGEIAIRAWAGHPASSTQVGGTAWILAEQWQPYQAANFVTPPFAGFVSGHSTFSRAAAEVLTHFTGDGSFPGGLGSYTASVDDFLRFETGPSEQVVLEWATYYDAADEAGISRLYGGIHVAADDYQGRILGSKIGIAAFEMAQRIYGDASNPVISAPAQGNASWHLLRDGDELELIDEQSFEVQRWSLAELNSLTFVGRSGQLDTLTIDLSVGGNFTLPGNLHFIGGDQDDDQLIVIGTTEADSLELTDDVLVANDLTVRFSGVEQLQLRAAAGNDLLQAVQTSAEINRLVLLGDGGGDTYRLAAADAIIELTDTAGIDTLDFSLATGPLKLQLALDRGQPQQIGAGNMQLHLDGLFERVIGTAQDDRIWGNGADNHLEGGDGNDRLLSLHGDDVLIGGAGDDVLCGGPGDDQLEGGAGDDWLFGGFGNDSLDGGADFDRLFGGFGNDTLENGEGPLQQFLRQNPINHFDVDADDSLAPNDALLLINYLNQRGSGPILRISLDIDLYLDVSGDNFIAPVDVVMVINELNAEAQGQQSAEAEATPLFSSIVIVPYLPERLISRPAVSNQSHGDAARNVSTEPSPVTPAVETDALFQSLTDQAGSRPAGVETRLPDDLEEVLELILAPTT